MTSTPPENSGIVILVVDDEESMRFFLRNTLRREGYAVLVAEDGPAAIALAQAEPPDVALVDVRMPGMDGVALMRALRATLPDLPVILMTGYGSVQSALHAMKQGATDYMTKPFRVDAIRSKVAKALASSPEEARPQTLRATAELRDLPRPEIERRGPDAPAEETPERRLVAFLRERSEQRGLPAGELLQGGDLGLRDVVRLAEMVWVDEVLELTGGNVSRAAEIAGITRPNMHRKVIDLGLSADTYRQAAGRTQAE